jgi:hypothetical protein
MALPVERKLTFLRGSGFLLSLVGVWDLMADESSQWPSQKGFLIFKLRREWADCIART